MINNLSKMVYLIAELKEIALNLLIERLSKGEDV